MRPDAMIARLSGQACTAASRTAGSGDPGLFGHNCAIAFIVSRPAQDLRPAFAGSANGLLAFIQRLLTKALAVEQVSGKHQMGSARLSKGSTVLNRESAATILPLARSPFREVYAGADTLLRAAVTP